MATTEKALRETIVAHGATAGAAGFGGALVGDISARFKDSLLIAPSAGSQQANGQSRAVLLSNYCALTTAQRWKLRWSGHANSKRSPASTQVGRIGERLKSNGEDVQARIAALVETRAKPKRLTKAKCVARKRRSQSGARH